MWITESSVGSRDHRTNKRSLDSDPLPHKTQDDEFTLLSYNVDCDVRGDQHYPSSHALNVITAITTIDADIVCLQETHYIWKRMLDNLLDQTKYPYQVWHEPSFDAWPGGIAVLSKFPIVKEEILNNVQEVEGSWFPIWVGAVQLPNHNQVRIYVVHLRPPLYNLGYDWGLLSPSRTNANRLAEVKYLVHHLANSSSSLPTIIVGDFNENDGGDTLDFLTNGGTGAGIGVSSFTDFFRLSAPTKQELQLRNIHLRDALHEHVPSAVETHRWPLPSNMVLRSRVDHAVYTTDSLTCLDCCIVPGYEEEASDHMPVFAFFKINEVGEGGKEGNEG